MKLKFQIGRGHDGPARVGELILNEETAFPTPTLTGLPSPHFPVLAYSTVETDSHLDLENIPYLSTTHEGQNKSTMLLLPSPISFSEISEKASSLDLRYQLEFLREHLKTSRDRAVVRISNSCNTEALLDFIPLFEELGVHSAAFTMDGYLGPNDFANLVLRSKLPLSWLTLALGRIHPSSIPILYYMGFDVLDLGHAYEAAAMKQRLWPDETERIAENNYQRFCSCPYCLEANGNLSTIDLESHNMLIYHQTLSRATSALQSGRLRNLVESMTHSSPANASSLRRIDTQLYDFIEEFTPSVGPEHLPLIGPESYNAPAVKRFRDRVAERYSPPENKQILLLLPCSARKPYSDSRSHKRFLAAIESGIGRGSTILSETILTSPLGVVPRELERAYPAASYDIPVTGVWDHEETEIAASALVNHLKKFSHDAVVVAHVSGGYLDIVRQAESRIGQGIIYTTADHSPTKRDSLDALRDTLRDVTKNIDMKRRPHNYLKEIVQATTDFQFGKGAGEILIPDNTRIRGKPYGTILCKIEGQQVCSFVGSTGTISLTLAGGRLLQQINRYWVRFDAPRAKGGSIFAVGIKDADPIIQPGDEVVVVNQDDELVAVGKSEMSGREMCELNRGRAVTIRHKLEGRN